jgi:hypothetical protein
MGCIQQTICPLLKGLLFLTVLRLAVKKTLHLKSELSEFENSNKERGDQVEVCYYSC